MNDDVLSKIAGFCGIDGQRALGLPPSKLKRNADFDLMLQTIHNEINISAPYESRYGPSCQSWEIILNQKIRVFVDLPVSNEPLERRTVFDILYCVHHAPYYVDSCRFSNDRVVRRKGKEGVVCQMKLDPPVPGCSAFVTAFFAHGNWEIDGSHSHWRFVQSSGEEDSIGTAAAAAVAALRKRGFLAGPPNPFAWTIVTRKS
jgi:hypothetical protein